MLKKIIILNMFLFSLMGHSQAKKPTLMIKPDDNWCQEKEFMMEFDNEGIKEFRPDYATALVKYSNLRSVILKIDQEMRKDGFETIMLDDALKQLKNDAAENAVKVAKGDLIIDPIDKLRAVAAADIEFGLYWKIAKQGPRHRIEQFRLSAIDSYTGKAAAYVEGGGEWASASEVAESDLLREAVISKMDGFKSDLMSTFTKMFEEGREIKVEIAVSQDLGKNFESDFGDATLSENIEDWITEHAVKNRLGTVIVSSDKKKMTIPGIKIAFYNEKQKPQDAAIWARPLKAYIKSLGIKGVTADKIGLGKVKLLMSNTVEE
jgi:hypothetical protein